jgi:hypothetical protein
LGVNEFRTKIVCVNDLSNRRKPKAEEKDPRLLADIIEIMNPYTCSRPNFYTLDRSLHSNLS